MAKKKKRTRPAPAPNRPTRTPATATHSPKRVVRSRSRRVVVADDEEIFIPKSARVSPPRPANDAEGAEDAVFIPRPGPPVQVQSDWVDDVGSAAVAGGITSVEFFDSVEWRDGDRERLGYVFDRRRHAWVCQYGCPGFPSPRVAGIASHRYDCAYWDREGKTQTPF